MCVSHLCLEFRCVGLFFFKQKTAYDLRVSGWGSDVCASDLPRPARRICRVTRAEGSSVRPSGLPSSPAPRMSPDAPAIHRRSEERRVGKECVSTCGSRWSPYHKKKEL